MNIIVLLYTHKHGTDCSVFTTMELATQGAATIIIDNLSDLDDNDELCANLEALYKDKNYEQLCKLWDEYQGKKLWNSESIELCERELFGFPVDPVVWATDDAPFTGSQVKGLLEENSRLRKGKD
jgi:hypothetical protein